MTENLKATAADTKIKINRKTQVIERDISRVICRLLMYGGNPERVKSIVQRIQKLTQSEVVTILDRVIRDFSDRHKNIRHIFIQHYKQVRSFILHKDRSSFSQDQKLLIGAYFTMEYAIESAALFNPSIVPHPDQSPAPEGSLRFIMSLRAVGEGHISSMVFRSGLINGDGELEFDSTSSFVKTPEVENPIYNKSLFRLKLEEMQVCDEIALYILRQLPKKFSYDELKEQITQLSERPRFNADRQLTCFQHLRQLADSDYQLKFEPEHDLSERVIFPVSEEEKGGIEDARFVKFKEENNSQPIYYATYTAYDGRTIMPQLIETRDFNIFKINPLYGDAVQNKGMALFPRKVDGRYAMLSRQDGENNRIMFSEKLHHWQKSRIIQKPCEPWELIQLGNCGSPLEISEGWLVLTHGVGPMRTYSIGAILLDLEDPTKVIGKLEEPMLRAFKQERVGYVPNVVYTCGSIIHNDRLIIPYSMSDIQPAIASIEVDELLDNMKMK